MDNLHLFDADEKQDRLDKMSLSEQVKNGYWREYLTIKEICDFLFPVPSRETKPTVKGKVREWRKDCSSKAEDNARFKDRLIKACKDDLLKYEGVIKGWGYNSKNPHPLAGAGQGGWYIPDDDEGYVAPYTCQPHDCSIHKNEFKRYLESIGEWPINGLLANWWADDKPIKTQPDKPSCGTRAIHKVIDDFFYSIKEPPHEIDDSVVLSTIIEEIDNAVTSRLIDINNVIEKITDRDTSPVIHWITKKGKSANLGSEQFSDLINKLIAENRNLRN